MRTIFAFPSVCSLIIALCPLSGQAMLPLHSVQDMSIDVATNHLTRLGWIGVSPHNVIVIAQPADESIRFFSKDGSPAGAIGKAGEGVGEFSRIGTAGWRGDSLWVNDPVLHRITLVSPSFVASRTLSTANDVVLSSGDASPLPPASAPGGPAPVALYADGSMLLSGFVGNDANVPASWKRIPQSGLVYVRTGANGVLRSVTGWSPLPAVSCQQKVTPHLTIAMPLCAETVRAIAADGSLLAFAVPSPDSGNFALTVLGSAGDTVLARKYPFAAVPISAHDADSIIDRFAARRSQPEIDALHAYHLTMYPPLVSLVIGRDSTVWVEQAVTKDGRPWLVIDAKGNRVGTLTLPSTVRLKVADRSNVWAISEGAEEVKLVHYTIKR